MGAIGSLISGAFSTLNSGLGYLSSKKLAEQQNQYMIDQWNRENEYNLPVHQMQRMVDAGLSPNLMYGHMDNGNAGSIASGMSAGQPYKSNADFNVDIVDMMKGIEDLKTRRLQNLDLASQIAGRLDKGFQVGQEEGFSTNVPVYGGKRFRTMNEYVSDDLSRFYRKASDQDLEKAAADIALKKTRNTMLDKQIEAETQRIIGLKFDNSFITGNTYFNRLGKATPLFLGLLRFLSKK